MALGLFRTVDVFSSLIQVKTMMLGPQYEHHVGTPNFMAPEAVDGKASLGLGACGHTNTHTHTLYTYLYIYIYFF